MITKSIDEVTETLIDYRGKTPKKTDKGIKLITAKVIKDGFIINGNHEYISEEEYGKWMTRGLPKQGDILITTEAPLGEVARLRTPEKVALAQRVILLRANPNIIDQTYCFYALRSPYVRNELMQRATGTTVLGIKQSELRQVKIPYHPLPAQRKIAAILSAYDDLIENNNRRIRILEEMAQLIYREWFVKFRFPGYEKVRMVDSELGPIPEGWEVKKLGDVLELAYGKALKKNERRKGTIPVFGSSGVIGYHDEYLVKGPGIIVGRKGNVGSVFWSNENFYPIDTVFYVITELNLPYCYHALKEQNFINNDSAVPGLSRNQAYLNRIVVPTQEILQKYNDHINPIFSQLYLLDKKNLILRRTRDLLLPKLISGELNVEDLDIAVGGD
ncbi:MAG TPA: restriction endonuclease subunit S [Syntrophothermus lipocalidus]|nr:restriction endonuclease subunit S [Syntrophothermus lipocalidus]